MVFHCALKLFPTYGSCCSAGSSYHFSVITAPCKIKPALGMYCRPPILAHQQPSF